MHADININDIERESYKHSPIHHLDGRAKIIALLLIIFYAVSLPRLEHTSLEKLAIIETYLIILIALAKLNPLYTALRYLLLLPFGLGIAVLQPFLRQGFIDEFTIHTLPLGLTWTSEGLLFGSIIFSKFTVCVTSIILLSSTTTMRDMVESAQRLHFPKEFALLLTMMIRYLFLFWSVLKRMRTAQTSRCFSPWNKKVKRKWILEQIAYTITTMFLRSYEQGERTYYAMLSRGYDHTTTAYVTHKKIKTRDIIFITTTLTTIILTHLFA